MGIAAFLPVRSAPVCHSSVFQDNLRDLRHDLGNNCRIGQWFPKHRESYYQSTVTVARHCLSSLFTSESKTASRGKSEISDRCRIPACTQLQPLPLSNLPKLLVRSYQGSKNRISGQVRRPKFWWQIRDFRLRRNFAFTQLLGRFGFIELSERAKNYAWLLAIS